MHATAPEPQLDPYRVLGVPRTADAPAVRRAYLRRIKRVHPDRAINAADLVRRTAAAARLNAAYGVLRDPVTRAGSDRGCAGRVASSARPGPAARGTSPGECSHTTSPRATARPEAASRSLRPRPATATRPRRPPARRLVPPGARPRTDRPPALPLRSLLWWTLRETHVGRWIAVALAVPGAWVLGLMLGRSPAAGPDWRAVCLFVLVQPLIVGSWHETPLADARGALRRVITWTFRLGRAAAVRLSVPSGEG